MGKVLAYMRGITRQWLGVFVPREWNTDGDRCSRPWLLREVLRDARAAGIWPRVTGVPTDCWDMLEAATRI